MQSLSKSLPSLLLLLAASGGLSPALGCGGDGGNLGVMSPEVSLNQELVQLTNVWIGATQNHRLTLTNSASVPAGSVTASLDEGSGPAAASVHLVEGDELDGNSTLDIELRITALGPNVGLFTSSLNLTVGTETFQVPVLATVVTAPSCVDANPCMESWFDVATGGCVTEARPDGMACEDDDVCTLDTVCSAGHCVGELLNCDDGIACTADLCDPESGCAAEPVDERCADEDPCTDDVCSGETGCSNATSDDGTLCHQDGCSEIGLCVQGGCMISQVTEGFPCDDEDSCTFGETCSEGVCGGGTEGALSAQPPVVVAEGNIGIDLCLATFDGCSGYATGTAEEVLATEVIGSTTLVLWRSTWHHTWGGSCSPASENVAFDTTLRVSPEAPPPPQDTADAPNQGAIDPDADQLENPGAAPPVEACAAGIFLSRHTTGLPGADLVQTQQIASTRGPAAGAFEVFEDRVRIGVAVGIEMDALLIEHDWDRATGGLLWLRSLQLFRPTSQGIPARTLALDYDTSENAAVAMTGAIRQASLCDALCDDGNCCDSKIEIFVTEPDGGYMAQEVIVPEIYDENCPAMPSWAGGYSWTVRDFAVSSIDDRWRISMLMPPAPCNDLSIGVQSPLQPLRFEAASSSSGWLGMTPAFFDTELDVAYSENIHRLHPVANQDRLLAAVEMPCGSWMPSPNPDNDTQPMVDCYPRAMTTDLVAGEPTPATDWGDVQSFNTIDLDVLPLVVQEQDFVLTRAAGLVSLRRLDPNGAISTLYVDSDPNSTWREDRELRAAGDAVAGIQRHVVTIEDTSCCGDIDGAAICDCGDCDGTDDDCDCNCGAPEQCSCGQISQIDDRVAVQRFSCVSP